MVFFFPYNLIMKIYTKILLAFSATCLINGAVAQGSGSTLFTVNGAKITSGQLDQWVSVVVSGGGKDTPELRQALLNELIVQEAITQDVKKTGLLTKGDNAFKLKLAEKNAVVEIWFSQYFTSHPLTDSDIRTEYEKQVAMSKDPKNAKEYQLSQIVVASEADGNQILTQLKSGASFAALAKEKSLDKASAANGGLLGWALPTQLASPLNDLVPTLAKGGVASKPIQIGIVWHIVKVDDIKPFVMPSFDQAKDNIAKGMVEQRRQEAIKQLMQNVKIAKGN